MMATLAMNDTETTALAGQAQGTKHPWLYVVSHTDPRYGGLSSAVPALAASVSSQGSFNVSVAAFCAPGENYQPPALSPEQISFWPTSRQAWLMGSKRNGAFADAIRAADGLHVHGIWEASTAIACKLARKLDKPYVLSAHGMLEPWALATKALKKRVYGALIERANVSGAACLHALTQAEAAQYRDFGAECPIAVVPNSVNLPQDSDPDLFLERFPELRGKRIVLFLSRLHPKKGVDLLVAAWGRLSKEHPEAQLVIAGPDSDGMQAQLIAQASEAGVLNRLTFTGMLAGDLKWSALSAAEAYVLPSYSEGLSMALLEAMGIGLPVIATRACNMPEITENGAGWEVEATADGVTSALGDLLRSPREENWTKGRNGARLIAARYSPTQVARQMAEVYEYVLGGVCPASVQTLKGGER